MITQNNSVGASSGNPVEWHSINWAKCHQEVRRLQVRIVKATQEGRHGKVKALQWLLTHSFSGKAIAVKRVTENQGKKTPGVDGETWSNPRDKSQAIMSLKRQNYKTMPLKRIHIPKANGKKRPLGIPTMKDRAMQALYLLALEPVAETKADKRSFGFRPRRSTADAIEQCFSTLCRKDRAEWILEGDIKGCFDNISHDWLMDNVPTDKTILKKWLKAGFVENRQLYPTESGTPQGGIISPVLANMTLDGLEKKLMDRWKRTTINGKNFSPKVNYVRYADDFIVTGYSKELLEQEIKPMIEEFMEKRGLMLSPEKTKITHIEEGFDFLGQNVRKYNGKLLIKPSKKNIKTFLEKVRTTIKENKTAKQENLIRLLNPMIVGWTNYHKHVVSKKIFSSVDSEIWKKLWQWASRRHPNKGKRWIKDRYWKRIGGRNWVFAAETGEKFPDGNPITVNLRKASDVKIVRHKAIHLEANSFDPQWEEYFEVRESVKLLNTIGGRNKLIRLWKSQGGICPRCSQPITKDSGWNKHYIIPKVDGGGDEQKNLVMVHPNCHRQIHAKGIKVVKPASARRLGKA
jgi:RNA-directed DNA polymerase